ncbi:MAG TPA: tetratricopeptide repeat protein [Usitatibacteraceae bacterium]
MSTYDLEEQERLAALKDWWDEWSIWIYAAIAALVLGVAGVYGWREFQKNQNDQAEVLLKSVKQAAAEGAASQDSKKLSEAANTLADKFPTTFQATEAQLMAAKAAFAANDFAAAKTHLQWVIDKGRDTHRNIARLRLATVLLEMKNYDDALKLLDTVRDEAYLAAAADLKGDVLAVQGRRDEARAAYQTAIDKSDARNALKPVSQAKLDALGGALETKKAADGKDDKGAGK